MFGLSRSDAGAEALTRAGAEVFRGDVNDLDRLRTAAEAADGVIHAAFNHDFSNLKENSEDDRKVIETLGEVLAGSDRPLVITSGTGLARSKTGGPAVETDDHVASAEFPRAASEEAADALIARGVRVMVMRLSQVHNTRRFGRVTQHIQLARQQGRVAYVGKGKNRSAGRARLRRRPALPAGAREGPGRRALPRRRRGRGCPARHRRGDRRAVEDALESITPEEAPEYFGWLPNLATIDLAASSALTRQQLGWNPTGPDRLTDLRNMDCNAAYAQPR